MGCFAGRKKNFHIRKFKNADNAANSFGDKVACYSSLYFKFFLLLGKGSRKPGVHRIQRGILPNDFR